MIDNITSANTTFPISLLIDQSIADGSVVGGEEDEEDDPCQYVKHNWLTAKLILMSIVGTTIATLGILGNITTTLVLTRPTMRTPNNLYLTFLAIFDTLLLISAIVLYSIEYIYEYTDSLVLYTVWLQYVRYGFALSHVAQTGSVYITVAVTFERLLAVLYPQRAKTMCTHDRASLTIVLVVAFSIMFNSTKYFEVEVVYVQNCTGFGAQHLVPSALLNNDLYTTVHSLWLTQFVMVFVPFVILFAINAAIVYRVRRSLKKLSWIQRGRKRDQLKEKSRDATRVLIVIVVVFLLCNALGFVVTLLESLYTQRGLLRWCPGFYAFAREAVNFLAIVNSSINFVIYCVFGQDFRRELISVWGCRKFAVMMPVGDKFTAEGLMINSNFHRRPSMFVRYVGMIRQSSAAQLYETGNQQHHRPRTLSALRRSRQKRRRGGGENGGKSSLANVKGILASIQPQAPPPPPRIAAPSFDTPETVGSKRRVIITTTSTEYTDDDEAAAREEYSNDSGAVVARRKITKEDATPPTSATVVNGTCGSGGRAYFLPSPLPVTESPDPNGHGPVVSNSHSFFNLSAWRDRLPSSANKRRRCSAAVSSSTTSMMLEKAMGRGGGGGRTDEKSSNKSSKSDEHEPLAPFLLGMLISTAPTVRQAGIEKAKKHYEQSNEEMVWV